MVHTKLLKDISSYELLYGKLRGLTNLNVFSCLSYATTLRSNRLKFDPRAPKCVFLGYKPGNKRNILLDVNSREIIISRNVHLYYIIWSFPFTIKTMFHTFLRRSIIFIKILTNLHQIPTLSHILINLTCMEPHKIYLLLSQLVCPRQCQMNLLLHLYL